MQMVTLGFPLFQVYRHKQAERETYRAIATWQLNKDLGFATGSSMMSESSGGLPSVSGQDMDQCIANANHPQHHDFYLWTCRETYSGENTTFLLKVLNFKKQWDLIYFKAGKEVERARWVMYRLAVNIFLSMVYLQTAHQPINVESPCYKHLESLFLNAAKLVASDRPATPTINPVTPWDEPLVEPSSEGNEQLDMTILQSRHSIDNASDDPMVDLEMPAADLLNDKLLGFKIPKEFDKKCFDAAEASIKNLVWTTAWQQFKSQNKIRPRDSLEIE